VQVPVRQGRTLSLGEVASAALGSAITERKGPSGTPRGGQFTAGRTSYACAAGGRVSRHFPCRPRYAPRWLQQDSTTRRRRNFPVLWPRGGTTMSLRESALTVGHNQACSSLPGGSVVRAAADSRQWQRS